MVHWRIYDAEEKTRERIYELLPGLFIAKGSCLAVCTSRLQLYELYNIFIILYYLNKSAFTNSVGPLNDEGMKYGIDEVITSLNSAYSRW